jgi:glutamate--cysteine ligase
MMTQTASVQCAFDYEDHADWRRKFRAAALLAPAAVALFANSSRADGKPTGWRSYRQRIWQDTDPDRCGLPAVVFEPSFDIEAWLDWVLATPTIFRQRARGLVPTGGIPFRELMERRGCDVLRWEDWELHASTIFTEVRSYSYIEVRSADLLPRELVMSVPALWTGILYDEQALDRALELGQPFDDHGRWREAMTAAGRDGMAGRAAGVEIGEQARALVEAAIGGLGRGARCTGDGTTGRAALERLAAWIDRSSLS